MELDLGNGNSAEKLSLVNPYNIPAPKIGEILTLIFEPGKPCKAHDNARCPVARHLDGRLMIPCKPHHDKIKPGEQWKVRVVRVQEPDEGNGGRFAMVEPLEKVFDPTRVRPRLPPILAGCLITGTKAKLLELEKEKQELSPQIDTIRSTVVELRSTLARSENELSQLESKLEELQSTIDFLENAIEDYSVQQVSDDLSDVEDVDGCTSLPISSIPNPADQEEVKK